jgi:poly(A) polymerase
MLLRCSTGELPSSLGFWWTQFIDADLSAREELIVLAKAEDIKNGNATKLVSKRRRHKSKGASSPSAEFLKT